MAAFLLVMKRRRRCLIGPLCLMGLIQWQCRRVFCPRAKPPLLVQAPTPTPALHPPATRNDVHRSLLLTESLMHHPLTHPDLPYLLLFVLLLLSHTRRRRTPAFVLHARPQGPKLAGHPWMPSFLPSSSSSSVIVLEEPVPSAGKMLHWVSSMYNHKSSLSPLSSSSSTWTPTPRPLKPQLNMALSDRVTVLVRFLHQGANWGSLSGRGWTVKPCDFALLSYLNLII